jgi:hypothetical protein
VEQDKHTVDITVARKQVKNEYEFGNKNRKRN